MVARLLEYAGEFPVRELYLLRHAKATTESPSSDDHGRQLAQRGEVAAQRLGEEMAGRSWYPHRALVSTATRTRSTWRLVADGIGDFAPSAYLDDRLYLARPGQALDIIRETPDSVQSLIIVGHNPTMHELSMLLSGDGSDKASLNQLRLKFSPASLARFEFDGSWETLNPHQPRLSDFLRPRDFDK